MLHLGRGVDRKGSITGARKDKDHVIKNSLVTMTSTVPAADGGVLAVEGAVGGDVLLLGGATWRAKEMTLRIPPVAFVERFSLARLL